MQPKWLVSQFDELIHQTDFQEDVCTSSAIELERLQAQMREYLQRATQEYYRLQQQLEQRINVQHKARQQFSQQQILVQSQHEETLVQQTHCEDAVKLAATTLTDWQAQLVKAKNWRANAQDHVDDCEVKVAQAERKRVAAQRSLNSAQDTLAARQNQWETVRVGTDRDGNATYRQQRVSTHIEQAAVNAASSALQRCENQLRDWTRALSKAVGELNNAKTQCRGSQSACDDAKKSQKIAAEADDIAVASEASAQQAVTEMEKAGESLQHSDEILQQLTVMLQGQLSLLQTLDKQVELGQTRLRDVHYQLEGLSQFMFRLKQVLNDKSALLIAFERPLTFC